MTGSGNWTYLIRGAAPLLIDAGVGQPAHLEALFTEVPGGPSTVVVTHGHADHASGAPAIGDRVPAAAFHKWSWPERDAASAVAWRPLRDGQRFETPDGPLTVVHTPGHSPDHVVLWHEASRTAFTGDLLILGNTVVIPASAGGVLADYLSSLRRLAALGPARALPAHGPPIDDPLALVDHYLAHRHERETQIVELLSGGPASASDIAERLYRGFGPALMRAATESVTAHLHKLAGEGRASTDDAGRWRLAW